MNIKLENIGKRFNAEWIFRGLNAEFAVGYKYAILGSNGSGKSTLIQVIGGNISPSEGRVEYLIENKLLDAENIYSRLSFASPYLELEEDLTLEESIKFHFSFKKPIRELTGDQVIEMLELDPATKKQVKYFSSGMKQRLKIGLAVFSDTPLLFLDEPSSNLDASGIYWYRQIMKTFSANRLVIICSNHEEEEYDFCDQKINIGDYKT